MKRTKKTWVFFILQMVFMLIAPCVFVWLQYGDLTNKYISAKTIHPVVSTMLPKKNKKLKQFILDWCNIKNIDYKGEAGLQFSINSTDNAQRDAQFNSNSLSLEEISALAKELPQPVGRKYTLNFAVTKETILDADRLTELFDPKMFIVKITPIHETNSAIQNGFDVTTSYDDYDVYRELTVRTYKDNLALLKNALLFVQEHVK